MKRSHVIPQIPKGIQDPVVEKYLRDMQKLFLAKHEDDYASHNSGGSAVGADIIIKYEIESLITHWALVDPTQLPSVFQICDGSAWRSGSYAETFWTPKGLTKIPNLCGYGLRASDRGTTQNDPDRNDRRQAVTGQVLAGGLTVSLPLFYCNIIKEAMDKGRTIQIGIQNYIDMFGSLSPVSTVTAVNLTTKIVTLTTGSALTVGATALIIRGDCIGSFQIDQYRSHYHISNGYHNIWGTDGAVASLGVFGGTAVTGSRVSASGGNETRGKNISYLPVMWVSLSGGSSLNIDSSLMPVCTDSEAVSGVRNDVVLTPYELRKALNAEGSAPVYACRVWCNFDGTTSPITIKRSGNVSSITDGGVGQYTVNFITPINDSNYSCVAAVNNVTTNAVRCNPINSSSAYIGLWDGAYVDQSIVTFMAVG